MSRFESRSLDSIKVGDVIVSTSGNSATRNLITQVRHNSGSSRYVFNYFGMAGANYVALDAPDSVTVDTLAYDVMTPDNFSETLYQGQLALYSPAIKGGYIACKILEIDLESKTAQLLITATRHTGDYSRGDVVYSVPFSRIAHRAALRSSRQRPGFKYELFRPRFSARWIDYLTAREITR